MKVAALYDIHGNYPALMAILKNLDSLQPDLVVLGGDLISGPMPIETMEVIERLKNKFKTVSIMGNNDQDVIDAFEGKPLSLSEHAEKQIRWVASKLTDRQILKLKRLPLNVSVGNYFFCHAVANDNRTIFTPHTDLAKTRNFFQNVEEPFIICGHTHLQFRLNIGNKIIFNAGSVGMPFSDQEGAQWLWIEDQTVHLKTTMINREDAIKAIENTDFPYLDEFVESYVKNTVSVSNAYKILDKLSVG